VYSGNTPVIFGHHVVGNNPMVIADKVYGIDTGACHGGRLTGLMLPSFEIAQIQSPQDYWHAESVKWQLPVMKAKPWGSYKWAKIQAICDEFRHSPAPEVAAFIAEREQWMNDLLALAPLAILKVEQKLADSIALYGVDEFKKHARCFGYATLLFKANSSNLDREFLQQVLPTPDKWLQVMAELGVRLAIDPTL
jgi:serine/threonine protein phosphatase 1